MDSLTGPLRDSKTLLQEWAQGRGQGLPNYTIVERSGPDHAPIFRVAVMIDGETAGEGQGKSKRDAEQAAAAEALAKRAG